MSKTNLSSSELDREINIISNFDEDDGCQTVILHDSDIRASNINQIANIEVNGTLPSLHGSSLGNKWYQKVTSILSSPWQSVKKIFNQGQNIINLTTSLVVGASFVPIWFLGLKIAEALQSQLATIWLNGASTSESFYFPWIVESPVLILTLLTVPLSIFIPSLVFIKLQKFLKSLKNKNKHEIDKVKSNLFFDYLEWNMPGKLLKQPFRLYFIKSDSSDSFLFSIFSLVALFCLCLTMIFDNVTPYRYASQVSAVEYVTQERTGLGDQLRAIYAEGGDFTPTAVVLERFSGNLDADDVSSINFIHRLNLIDIEKIILLKTSGLLNANEINYLDGILLNGVWSDFDKEQVQRMSRWLSIQVYQQNIKDQGSD